MAYARERNDTNIVPRYDICVDRDMMAIEIQQRPHQPVFGVNKNNQPSWEHLGILEGPTNELLNLPDTCSTVIAGDFALHRLDWKK